MADRELPPDFSRPDPHFEPSERLFRRIPLADVVNGFVSDASLPSPAFSVDREKYRKNPADLLAGHPEAAIAAFRVGEIPAFLTSDDGRRFEFGVEHKPVAGNYAHSEVQSYENDARLEGNRKPPSHIRKKFRDLLRQRIEILSLE